MNVTRCCPNEDCDNRKAKAIKSVHIDGLYYNCNKIIVGCDKCCKAFKIMEEVNITELEVEIKETDDEIIYDVQTGDV